MKNLNLYSITGPVFVHYLQNLEKIITKAKKFSAKEKISEKKFLDGRLAPDMFNFIQQIGYSYFTALEATTNLTGKAAPQFTYDEKSFSELQKSLRRAGSFIKKCGPATFKNASKKRVTTFLDPSKKYPADYYVTMMALPNFYFHVTTAYDVLRHLGVPLKKDDYLG